MRHETSFARGEKASPSASTAKRRYRTIDMGFKLGGNERIDADGIEQVGGEVEFLARARIEPLDDRYEDRRHAGFYDDPVSLLFDPRRNTAGRLRR